MLMLILFMQCDILNPTPHSRRTTLDEPIEIASHSASFLSLGHFIDLVKKIEGFDFSDKI